MIIKLFTHTDLDGIGCAILAKLAFDKCNIEYCDYENINQKVKAFIENEKYAHFDYVYITDISINEEVAELIENTFPIHFKKGFNLAEMFQLLDHHKTAEWLNKYWWADVEEFDSNNKKKNSGTSMFYNELIENECLSGSRAITEFVETVRRYDTWEWQTKYDDMNPKRWNDLFHIYGRDKFIEKMLYQLSAHFGFSKADYFLLESNMEKIDKYIEYKQKQIVEKEISNYKIGVVFAEQYLSELGNTLATNNPHLDFIVIINMSKSVSYRGIKDDVDLGEFAKVYGGGGHPKSAGSPIGNDVREKIINLIFGKN